MTLDLSSIYFAHFSGCQASFVHSCHSTLECYNLFSGVKLSMRSFCFIPSFFLKELCTRLLILDVDISCGIEV